MLDGRQMILAGGSGGLGAATARLLANDGARLIVSFLQNRLRAQQLNTVAEIMQADLGAEKDRTNLLDLAPELYGLVVFSGDPARVKSVDELEAAMQQSYRANFLGPVLLAREAATRMKARGIPGAIVLISTMQAVSTFEGSTAYATQKAALIQAGKILAKECRGRANVRVNIVCPGVNQAGMAEASIASGKYDRYVNDDLVPRFGKADDVARVVRFLLEPDNYVTGQIITVDGGLTL
jgi:NAD(P)-dependent dehydrogenase (short-subunit alcohol dehydrogenase family)